MKSKIRLTIRNLLTLFSTRPNIMSLYSTQSTREVTMAKKKAKKATKKKATKKKKR